MTSIVTGRGAWTRRGFPDDFTTMYQRHRTGTPTGLATATPDQRAVHLGVLAIQKLLIMDFSSGPGIFGPLTEAAARTYQKTNNPPADGVVGPNTMRCLLRPVVAHIEHIFAIPDRMLWGIIAQESGYDPGAVGYTSPDDVGLVQINTRVHKVTVEQAFDPFYALNWAARELASTARSFIAKGANLDLAAMLTIASHNSPLYAAQWFTTGAPPNPGIAAYVTNIRSYADRP